MPILLTGNEVTIEEESEIMLEVKSFYKRLYMSEGSSPEVQVAREEILSFVNTKVTKKQRRKIEATPTSKEIRSILKQFPKSKVPRLDGMTVEVLLAYWSFLQNDCLAMIHQFWGSGVLAHQTTVKVIKLAPKKADKCRLKD